MTNMTIISKTPSNKAKTPFMLYADSKKLEESDYSILRENYANLSIDEKYKWVIKAVSEAHDKSVSLKRRTIGHLSEFLIQNLVFVSK